MWDPPRPELEPVSPALAGRFSTTAPPGKPIFLFFLSVFPVLVKCHVIYPVTQPRKQEIILDSSLTLLSNSSQNVDNSSPKYLSNWSSGLYRQCHHPSPNHHDLSPWLLTSFPNETHCCCFPSLNPSPHWRQSDHFKIQISSCNISALKRQSSLLLLIWRPSLQHT